MNYVEIDGVKHGYASYLGYSDRHAYEIVRVVSPKTLEIRRLKAERNPEYKPEFVVGGFSAVCTNMYDQKWLFESDEDAPVIRIRARKYDGGWVSNGKDFVLTEKPYEFYDYNF